MRHVVDSTGVKPSWGGARPGAGAKQRGTRRVPHRTRPLHKDSYPVHVTLHAREGLPSFRQQRVHAMLVRILERQKKRKYARDFQVVEYSVPVTRARARVASSRSGPPTRAPAP